MQINKSRVCSDYILKILKSESNKKKKRSIFSLNWQVKMRGYLVNSWRNSFQKSVIETLLNDVNNRSHIEWVQKKVQLHKWNYSQGWNTATGSLCCPVDALNYVHVKDNSFEI